MAQPPPVSSNYYNQQQKRQPPMQSQPYSMQQQQQGVIQPGAHHYYPQPMTQQNGQGKILNQNHNASKYSSRPSPGPEKLASSSPHSGKKQLGSGFPKAPPYTRTWYQSMCICFFWIKAFLAIFIALFGIGIQAFIIYDKYWFALRNPTTAIFEGLVKIPTVYDKNSSVCFHDSSAGLARLQPPGDSFLFGFHLQWDRDNINSLNQRIGKQPAIINSFVHINNTDFQIDMINWKANMIKQQKGTIFEISLMPSADIEQISDEQLYAFAVHMRHVNSYYGLPVLLRYMHELNGNWMAPNYGMRPIEAIKSFRTLATYVHRLTNMTAMVWGPNTGFGYPYIGSGYDQYNPRLNDPDPKRAANFRVLDTNGDGQLTAADDPYGPFYPGDEYVDWVALSIYNTGRDDQTRQTTVAPEGILGAFLSTPGNAQMDFYERFCASKNKPFLLAETGAAFITDLPGATQPQIRPAGTSRAVENSIKQAWWTSVFSSAIRSGQFPLWKAAVWFEEVKPEQSNDNAQVQVEKDYRITFSSPMRDNFLRDFNSLKLPWAESVQTTCSGRVTVRSS